MAVFVVMLLWVVWFGEIKPFMGRSFALENLIKLCINLSQHGCRV